MAVELVTNSEYARRRGCDEKAVRKAIAAGRITALLVDGRRLIDPSVADIQWARNTRPRQANARRGDAGQHASGAAPVEQGAAAMQIAEAVASGGDYFESRARRELAEAELAEHKLAELRGDLVRATSVRVALAKRAAAVREGLLQLPARVVPRLVAQSDPAAMDRILRDEISAAMAHLNEEA
jgi:hypothetical protein